MNGEKEIKNATFALMVVVALLFDVMQWALVWIGMDWIAGLFAFLTFYVWFKTYGMSFMTPKRFATMGSSLIIELIPVLSELPAWTLAVVVLVLDHKLKKKLTAIAAKPIPETQKVLTISRGRSRIRDLSQAEA